MVVRLAWGWPTPLWSFTGAQALEAICQKAGSDPAILNFMKVLIENKRLGLLGRTGSRPSVA